MTEECDAQERERKLDDARGGPERLQPRGGWPTCSNSHGYPEEMKTSISAELCGSCTPNPFHFLAGSLTISCFHSWLRDRLSLSAYLHI